jgi:glycosyltransferase involved in cell wall biosynthesis
LLRLANVVCPSGPTEAFVLEQAFGPLPLLAEHRFGTNQERASTSSRNGVICVGRLDPRKNQLNLIRALQGTGIPLQLIGTERVFPKYAEACRAVAGADVQFRGYVAESELQDAYARARVHALPSAFELPGLTSLDAAAAGAAVVASVAGTACDYFGRDAWYCNTDVASIRRAVLAAYEEGPPPGLADRIGRDFSWKRTADACVRAYTGTAASVGP